MDPRIAQLTTPQDCEQMAINVQERYPDLAVAARRRAVELRAMQHGITSEVEIEILKALYAYEAALTKKNGRTTRASRTWQMFKRHGIIAGAERAVDRQAETAGYQLLVEIGMSDFLFEAVIVRFPQYFTPAALEVSKKRLAELSQD